jgi:beta-1,4-mannosyl-glycoprotein beta-1,4-N-acetylglucosaminyltransferase
MSKIYDTFSFFNELDLLEIRLNILNEYVDYFVIVEATETFNGYQKILHFKENKDRFKKWENKIIHYIVEDYPNDSEMYQKALNSPNTGNKEHWWVREFYQKESLIKPLRERCNDTDIVFISDTDEIWNPKLEIPFEQDKVFRPLQTGYLHYLNNKSDQHFGAWTGTRVGYYKTVFEKGPNHFRTETQTPSIPLQNGGWHFSWLEKTSNKWNDNHPDNGLRYHRATSAKTIIDETELPEYIINNKDKWKHLFL